MKQNLDNDEQKKRIYTKANFYTIQYVWHYIKGARPKDFKLYDALLIKRSRYANIIKHGNPEFSEEKYTFLYSATGLPVQVFKGFELINTGITYEKWKEFFEAYDLYLENKNNDYVDKRKNIDNKLLERCQSTESIEGYYKILVDWFNGARRTDLAPDEYLDKLQTILNYITIYDLEMCTTGVLEKTIKCMDEKRQLMNAVRLCKKAKSEQK